MSFPVPLTLWTEPDAYAVAVHTNQPILLIASTDPAAPLPPHVTLVQLPEALAAGPARLAAHPEQVIWLAGEACLAHAGRITAAGTPGLGLAPALITTGKVTARQWDLVARQQCTLLQLRGPLQLTYTPADGGWRVAGGGSVLLGRPAAMAEPPGSAALARFQIEIFTGGDHFVIA